MKIREIFQKFGTYGGTVMTCISLESYIRGLKKGKIETYGEVGRRSMDKVQSTVDKIHNLNEQLQNKNVSVADKTNIENKMSSANSELKNGLVEVNQTLKSIIEAVKGDNSSSSTGLIDLDTIQEFMAKYQMFIDQLSHEHKYAVIHISFSITILFCLFTLVSIHSGDRLIEYFKIEEKYPKLVRYILIRRKLKSYSFY